MNMRGVIGASFIGWYFIVLSFLMILIGYDTPWSLLKYYSVIVIAFLLVYFLKLKSKITYIVADGVINQANNACIDDVRSSLLAAVDDMSFSFAYMLWLPFIFLFDYSFNAIYTWFWGGIMLIFIIAFLSYVFILELKSSASLMINRALVIELNRVAVR